MKLAGQTLFVVGPYGPTVCAVDVSDPTAPHLACSAGNETRQGTGIALYDSYAYVVTAEGVVVYRITESPETRLDSISYLATQWLGCPRAFTVGNHLMVSSDYSGVLVWTLTDPAAPAYVTTLACEPGVSGIQEANGLLYVASWQELQIYDLATLCEAGTMPLPPCRMGGNGNYQHPFAIADGRLVMGSDSLGLTVHSLADPLHPTLIGSYRTPGSPWGVTVNGNRVAVADFTNLGLYDISAALPTSVTPPATIPGSLALLPAYPNPFNAVTQIPFALPNSGRVTLQVYDILGRSVATLADQDFSIGTHAVRWDAGDVASGRYFITLKAAGQVETRPVMLVK